MNKSKNGKNLTSIMIKRKENVGILISVIGFQITWTNQKSKTVDYSKSKWQFSNEEEARFKETCRNRNKKWGIDKSEQWGNKK